MSAPNTGVGNSRPKEALKDTRDWKDPQDPKSYRPVVLTSQISKMVERMTNTPEPSTPEAAGTREGLISHVPTLLILMALALAHHHLRHYNRKTRRASKATCLAEAYSRAYNQAKDPSGNADVKIAWRNVKSRPNGYTRCRHTQDMPVWSSGMIPVLKEMWDNLSNASQEAVETQDSKVARKCANGTRASKADLR